MNEFSIKNGELIKYNGSESNVAIPENVTEIGEFSFRDCKSLVFISIPDNVTKISDYAFCGCINLISVTIPNNVTEIGDRAFKNCASLTFISVPNSVKKIGYWIFDGCKNLISVTIPDKVTEIGYGAFMNCANMNYIIIHESVIDIANNAFDGCQRLTIICRENSYAHSFCIKNRLPFIFDYQFEAFHGLLPVGFKNLASPFLADEERPYIFISYSHKDRGIILPILKTLYESGWRIWYDEGLTIGDLYDKMLEDHIKNCSAFLLFVTEHSLSSYYIKENEIPWAIHYNKPIIKCIMDKGIDWRIK